MISLITVCRTRLPYLQRALASWQKNSAISEVIVVDASCADLCGNWLETHAPAVLVAYDREPVFSLSRSRNLGAARATQNWFLFCDCDVVTNPSFAESVEPLLAANAFATIERREEVRVPGVGGLLLCRKGDFASLDGYDEMFQSWGAEDDDMVHRLLLLGRDRKAIPWKSIEHLHHSDELRLSNLNMQNAVELVQHNIDYLMAKRYYMLLSKATHVSLAERRSIREFVSAKKQ